MKKLTIKSITDINYKKLNKMTKENLINTVKQATTYSKRRWNEFQKRYRERISQYDHFPKPRIYRDDSPIFNILSSDVNLSNMTSSELRHRLVQLRDYLKTKTSTMGGWEKTLQKFISKYNKEARISRNGPKVDKENYDIFWKVYNRVEEVVHANTLSTPYELWREVGEYINQHKDEDIQYNSEEEKFEQWANEIIERIDEKTLEGNYTVNDDEVDNKYVYRGNKKL